MNLLGLLQQLAGETSITSSYHAIQNDQKGERDITYQLLCWTTFWESNTQAGEKHQSVQTQPFARMNIHTLMLGEVCSCQSNKPFQKKMISKYMTERKIR